MVDTSSSDLHRDFGRDSPEPPGDTLISCSFMAWFTNRMVGCESVVFSALTALFKEEVVGVVSEGELRLDFLLDVPKNVLLDAAVEQDLQRIESDSDFDVFKVSILKRALSEMKRGLIGIETDSLLLFCFVSL